MKELSTISVVVTRNNNVEALYGYASNEQGLKEANEKYQKLSLNYLAKLEYNISLIKSLYKGATASNVRYIQSKYHAKRFAKIVDGKFAEIKQDGKILGEVVHGLTIKEIEYIPESGDWTDCKQADYDGFVEIAKPVEQPMVRRIHEYVKDMDDNRVGVFVGIGVCGSGFDIGWSKVNVNAGDVFDKEEGLAIALNRAQESKPYEQKIADVPESFLEYYKYFQGRCQRYFKCEQLLK